MQRMARMDYDGIEFKGEPDQYDIRNLVELCRKYGLEVSSIAGMYPWPTEERDLSNPNEGVRNRAVAYVKKCVDFASQVGAPIVIVVPSCVGKTKPLVPREDEWARAVESVRGVGEYAKENDVRIAIEPINRYETSLLNNAEETLKFIGEVGLESVKMMLDCFHMNIEEPDLAGSIRTAGKELIHVHVADSNRQSVGRGHTDFKSIMGALKEIGYSHYLTMEPLPPLSDPYRGLEETFPEEILDLYAKECIENLRYIEEQT